MIEQELASIIKFVLEAAGYPTPYYWSVPEGFDTPSVFFPVPEVDSEGETFGTYRLEYVWYLQFFHKDTNEAYNMAFQVYEAIKKGRNLVRLVDENGQLMRKGIRLEEPSLKKVDSGVAQLTIRYASRRPYHKPDSELMQRWTATVTDKHDGTKVIQTDIRKDV